MATVSQFKPVLEPSHINEAKARRATPRQQAVCFDKYVSTSCTRSLYTRMRSACCTTIVGLCSLHLAEAHVAAAPPAYQLVGSFGVPNSIFDVGPDGRIYTVVGDAIMRQDSVNGSSYTQVASLPSGLVGSFGASFIRFSPDGHKFAIGDGNFTTTASVHVIDADPLNSSVMSSAPAVVTASAITPNFDAAWDANSRLFITGARSTDFMPIVNRLDLPATPGGPTSVTTVLTNIGLGSGGIAINSGRVFTGCGFLPTGEIRSFDVAALSGPTSVPFSTGALFGSVLSAYPLAFDEVGSLLVGGGDSFSGTSEYGYAAILDPTDPSNPLRLSPAGPDALYGVAFNRTTHELLVYNTLNNLIHRYAIPSASASALLLIGVVVTTRRRRA